VGSGRSDVLAGAFRSEETAPARRHIGMRAEAGRTLRGEPELDVLERARDGDLDAFGELLARHDLGLRRLAYRLLGDRQRMDDVLQEAYVKAFRALPRFGGRSALGTWLYRIVYNACLDELRRASRAEIVPLDSVADPWEGRDHGDDAAGRLDLAAALDSLPIDQRAVVLLVDAEGMSYEAAGQTLGIAAGTVGSRLNRAHAALRAALQGEMKGVDAR
jgi:RNA polymerase sigma-70 factor, ECF subfamily